MNGKVGPEDARPEPARAAGGAPAAPRPGSSSVQAIQALQRTAGNSAVVRLLRSSGSGVVQRVVTQDPTRAAVGNPLSWVTDRAPGVYFPTSRDAQRHEDNLASQEWHASRDRRAGAGARMAVSSSAPARRGVQQADDAIYPDRALFHAGAEARALVGNYKRKAMGKKHRARLIAHAGSRGPSASTSEDARMQAAPGANMQKAKISMNHKLADSSVMAICAEIVATARSGGLDGRQREAIQQFAAAMCGPESAEAVRLLEGASGALNVGAARSLLKSGIDLISLGVPNLRFGDAPMNTRILYGFDANIGSDGRMTPLTSRIFASVRELADSGLVRLSVIDAALTATRDRATGAPLSSSRASGGGGGGGGGGGAGSATAGPSTGMDEREDLSDDEDEVYDDDDGGGLDDMVDEEGNFAPPPWLRASYEAVGSSGAIATDEELGLGPSTSTSTSWSSSSSSGPSGGAMGAMSSMGMWGGAGMGPASSSGGGGMGPGPSGGMGWMGPGPSGGVGSAMGGSSSTWGGFGGGPSGGMGAMGASSSSSGGGGMGPGPSGGMGGMGPGPSGGVGSAMGGSSSTWGGGPTWPSGSSAFASLDTRSSAPTGGGSGPTGPVVRPVPLRPTVAPGGQGGPNPLWPFGGGGPDFRPR